MSHKRQSSILEYALILAAIGIAVFQGLRLIEGAASNFIQANWTTQNASSNALLPQANWAEYVTKDTGVSAGGKKLISGRALCCYYGGGHSKELLKQQRISLMPQLSLSSLVTSMRWMYEETAPNKYYANETKRNPQDNRKLFKKITCQPYSKHSGAQIENRFCNKYPSRFIHMCYKNFSAINRICQEGI